MNYIEEQQKKSIKTILEKHAVYSNQLELELLRHFENLIADTIQDTINKCKEAVPEELDTENIDYPEGTDIGAYRHCEGLRREGHNSCRTKTLENIDAINHKRV